MGNLTRHARGAMRRMCQSALGSTIILVICIVMVQYAMVGYVLTWYNHGHD